MSKIDLNTFDLNLIKAFDALMRTRSVTEAAKEMRIGQSGMSQALSRLRTAFGDDLFVRTPAGMQPTKRAEAIAVPFRHVLQQCKLACQQESTFDPSQERFEVTIGMSDYTEAILLPSLLGDLAVSAPNMLLKVVQIELVDVLRMLDEKKIDVAIGQFPKIEKWQNNTLLFVDRRQCLYAANVRGADRPLDLDGYLARDHVVRSLGGRTRSVVDEALARLGMSRQLKLVIPRFSALPMILPGTNLVATLPATLAAIYERTNGLLVCDVPFDVPLIEVSMLWHATADSDPAAAWLRDRIQRVIKTNPLLARQDKDRVRI